MGRLRLAQDIDTDVQCAPWPWERDFILIPLRRDPKHSIFAMLLNT